MYFFVGYIGGRNTTCHNQGKVQADGRVIRDGLDADCENVILYANKVAFRRESHVLLLVKLN